MEEQLKRDFRNFLWLVWQHLNLPEPTPVQYDIAVYLQHGPLRAVIEAFRGVGKSWVTSAFVLWVLYCDPQKKILVVSASKERADSFTTFTRRLINEIPILEHLRARPGQRDSSLSFDVGPALAAHAPSVKSVGITGQIAGSRADIIIPDDIETPKNSLTQLMRDRLSEAIKEFDAVLTPKPDSRILYLGTPQTEMSVYNILPERGYEIRIWPARMPANMDKYEGRLAPYIRNLDLRPGDPTDVKRFDHEDLTKRECSYGRSGFALQFMLDTSLSDQDKHPLKLGDLIVMDLDKGKGPVSVTWASGYDRTINDLQSVGLQGDHYHSPMFISRDNFVDYTGSVMAIDPSGGGTDETAYAVVKILMGKLYLIASGGFTDGYSSATLEALADVAFSNGVNQVVIERNFGDGMFTSLFKPVLFRKHKCAVEEVRHSTQKEKRIIDTLEPLLLQHRLVVSKELVKKDFTESMDKFGYQLFYQMSRITKDKGSLRHDDRLEALAMACGYWVLQMERDEDIAAEQHRTELLHKELDKFIVAAVGKKGKSRIIGGR